MVTPLIALCPARSCEPVAEPETLPAGELGTVDSCPRVELADTTCPLTSFSVPLEPATRACWFFSIWAGSEVVAPYVVPEEVGAAAGASAGFDGATNGLLVSAAGRGVALVTPPVSVAVVVGVGVGLKISGFVAMIFLWERC